MRTLVILAAIITVCASGVRAAHTSSVRARITKVSREQRPMQSPPRLMNDVLAGGEADWNAVVRRDPRQAAGEYFLVMWKVLGKTDTVTVRFEYRQERSNEMKTKESVLPPSRGRCEFSITGDEFQKDGAVTSWRVTIEAGNQVLARTQSFMW